jgi:hypothetical protein
MLTFVQSFAIARRAIKAIGGTKVEDIDQNDTIERAGIPDPELGLRAVKRLVCISKEFGVPKYKHKIEFDSLSTVSIATTVGDFADVIQANAKPE